MKWIMHYLFFIARGHYVFMKNTRLRAGFQATLETDFLYLNGSCLQLFYSFIGESSETQIVVKLRQEVSFLPVSMFYIFF